MDQLNELIFLNAHNNVFFNQKTKKEYTEGLHYKCRREPKIRDLKREISAFKAEDPQGGKLFHFSHNRVRKKFDFPWMEISELAKSIFMPAHIGGINRAESRFIRDFLEKEKLKYAEEVPPFSKKFFRQ